MKSLGRFCLFITILLGASEVLAQVPSFQFLERPGPYPVGLKVVDLHDTSRSFPSWAKGTANAGKRQLQTLVWYPSSPGAGQLMTVGDYARLADGESSDSAFSEPNKWRSQLAATSAVRLWARRNVPLANNHFPVLIYAPSDSSTSWENADLCEYLASHGYVVLASPSMGASTRDMTDDLPGIVAQAGDISFLITFARTLPDTDVSKVAVVSWSWGGISSLFAAARDPRIKALAQMDGSTRYFPGLVNAGDIHPDKMTIPLLFFTAEYPDLIEQLDADHENSTTDRTGPSVLNAWKHGDLYTVNMIGMSHGEFGAMQQRRKTAERFAEDQIADYGRDDANTSHAWVARYILNFLNASLKQNAVAAAFLKRTPAENGVPKHFMAVKFRAAQSTAASH